MADTASLSCSRATCALVPRLLRNPHTPPPTTPPCCPPTKTFGEGKNKVKVYHHHAYKMEASPPFRICAVSSEIALVTHKRSNNTCVRGPLAAAPRRGPVVAAFTRRERAGALWVCLDAALLRLQCPWRRRHALAKPAPPLLRPHSTHPHSHTHQQAHTPTSPAPLPPPPAAPHQGLDAPAHLEGHQPDGLHQRAARRGRPRAAVVRQQRH